MTILILLPLKVWSTESFSLFGQTSQRNPTLVTLTLSGQTTWNEQMGGDAIVNLDMTNLSQENLTGELRLLILVINGRINFNAVTMKVLEMPSHANAEPPKKDTYARFFVEAGVTLGKKHQHWRFKITLPAGSRKPNMALQLFALYRGQMSSGESWIARDFLLLSHPSGR
ncbi:MAG: hypothetical protein DRR08_11325 [Candidatus Parabeggiatoa sp. nov. 2]|nr:MAG: hypothetical protein B6247_20305 [Beggiatoa sp. 4572_84]RKZ60441.1 MAG: hypothetical protein DRR08_11325 [Gammaproteobacteria bacterium]